MPQISIKIEKEDINTSKLGKNIMIECENNLNLIFSPEALKELIYDYNFLMDEN